MSSLLNGVSLLLAVTALGLGVAWWNTKKEKYGIGAGIAAALIPCLWFLGPLAGIETDEGQIEHKVQEMAAGVKAHDLDRVFAQISADFHYNALDKNTFRQRVEQAIRNRDVRDIAIWDFTVENISRNDRTAVVSFNVKPQGNWSEGREYYLCKAWFVLDPDNQWRLARFQIANPFVETNQPLAIPGF
jgi:hypothetical protein